MSREESALDKTAFIKEVGGQLRGLMTDDKLDPMFRVYASMARACILRTDFDLGTRFRVAEMLRTGVDWTRGVSPSEVDRADILAHITSLEETFRLT